MINSKNIEDLISPVEANVWNQIDKPMRPLIYELHRIGLPTAFSCCGYPYDGELNPHLDDETINRYYKSYHHIGDCYFTIDSITIITNNIIIPNKQAETFLMVCEIAVDTGWTISLDPEGITHWDFRCNVGSLKNIAKKRLKKHLTDIYTESIIHLTKKIKELIPSSSNEVIIDDGWHSNSSCIIKYDEIKNEYSIETKVL